MVAFLKVRLCLNEGIQRVIFDQQTQHIRDDLSTVGAARKNHNAKALFGLEQGDGALTPVLAIVDKETVLAAIIDVPAKPITSRLGHLSCGIRPSGQACAV